MLCIDKVQPKKYAHGLYCVVLVVWFSTSRCDSYVYIQLTPCTVLLAMTAYVSLFRFSARSSDEKANLAVTGSYHN